MRFPLVYIVFLGIMKIVAMGTEVVTNVKERPSTANPTFYITGVQDEPASGVLSIQVIEIGVCINWLVQLLPPNILV